MSRKNISKNNATKKARPERRSIPWRYRLLTVACGLLLVVGFFFAARQHFASFDFRIKNSRLKKQIEELEADKRRLQLAKEIALSPAEIKKAAKKIGLTGVPANKTSALPANTPLQEKPRSEKPLAEKPKPTSSSVVKAEETKEEAKKPDSEDKKSTEPKARQEKAKTPEIAKK